VAWRRKARLAHEAGFVFGFDHQVVDAAEFEKQAGAPGDFFLHRKLGHALIGPSIADRHHHEAGERVFVAYPANEMVGFEQACSPRGSCPKRWQRASARDLVWSWCFRRCSGFEDESQPAFESCVQTHEIHAAGFQVGIEERCNRCLINREGQDVGIAHLAPGGKNSAIHFFDFREDFQTDPGVLLNILLEEAPEQFARRVLHIHPGTPLIIPVKTIFMNGRHLAIL
jgi:hypothetical protein